VPDKAGDTPHYWSTWALQNYIYGQGIEDFDIAVLEGSQGAVYARANINEKLMFGTEGWVNQFYPDCRSDLFFVLDDGWDVPLENTPAWYSSFILSEEKFPSFAHLKPAQRLKKLNEMVKAAGWRGAGLWLAAEEASAVIGNKTVEEYWTERIRWCREAGIEYWKVDWGRKAGSNEFRRFLTDLAKKEYPDLLIEHGVGTGPFNATPHIDTGWVNAGREQASFSEVVRLYDVTSQLGIPVMLERVAHVLKAAENDTYSTGLLNSEDEVYTAAALGTCLGLLRHPSIDKRLRDGRDIDLGFAGPGLPKKRMDAVTRTTRWHRIAPAFAVGTGKVNLADESLTDSWKFERGECWTAIGELIEQTAPARVTRGLPLPEVKAEGVVPYVIASKNPNSVVSIATLGRMSHKTGWSEPRADVTLEVGEIPPFIGIFGHYKSLTLVFDKPIKARTIWGQDLAGDKARDITNKVTIDGNKLILPGKLIDSVGLADATPGDVSDPGMVLVLERNYPQNDHLALAQTPPMGWNSFQCFGSMVNEDELRENARMLGLYLKETGWEYVVNDIAWSFPDIGEHWDMGQSEDYYPALAMDRYGRVIPTVDRFPSATFETGFKKIAAYVHSLDLKYGIHIMRGVPRQAVHHKLPIKGTRYTVDQIADKTSTCGWCNQMYGVDMDKPGAQEYYDSLFDLYASWGVDFVKVDDIASPYHEREIEAIRKAIDKTGHPIVLSLSPGDNTPVEMAEHLKKHANMWRISSDFWDKWPRLKHQFELLHKWEDHIGDGHFPDLDIIPFGLLNLRGPNRGGEQWQSRFTRTEKFTLMTLWVISRNPLMYGGDLRALRLDELELITNVEVLDVDKYSSNNRQLFRRNEHVAWIADAPKGKGKYLALFNIGEDAKTPVKVSLEELGFKNEVEIRDLWNHQSLGSFSKEFLSLLEPHGSGLYLVVEKK
jgi:hypothetical protein